MLSTPTARTSHPGPAGRWANIRGRRLFEIQNVDMMSPFLMTVVGDTHLWMFLSSSGAFTAGRVEADRSLLPYETDDRLHELSGIAGPVTMVRFEDGRVWQPLRARTDGVAVSRTLRRSLVGDHVEFEETDTQTGVTFRVELGLSETFGIVRKCELSIPTRDTPITCELIDGYVHVMPAGVPLGLQQVMSPLVDGYKRTEYVTESGPAIYALESAISDRPEATESLRVNAIWHTGLEHATVSLSDEALRAFERCEPARGDDLVMGRRGAYLCRQTIHLAPGDREQWCIVGDVHLDHDAIARIVKMLRNADALPEQIDRCLKAGHERLGRILDDADGAQATADDAACAAHRSNVLFNAMRGGIPLEDYSIDVDSFRRFVHDRNAAIGTRHDAFLAGLESPATVDTLPQVVQQTGCPQLVRLALEYLPLTFGRRHGDPSRPWNRFRIRVRDDSGNRVIGYEGNWRDIFQNWEAMCRSYPAMLPGVVSKFLNASTIDGYNPYRINERGIDWEVPEPDNEWATIGYWGDHQIVYLLRLLEQCRDTQPDWLRSMMDQPVFSYANVPYRLRPFKEIAANPRSSITYDDAVSAEVDTRATTIGSDGRLVFHENTDEPALVTLLEKLLVPALAKVSCLVPGGGVWMNTQRPEWNDANNALAGFGLSMVTLYQVRRYCDFVASLINDSDAGETQMSPAISEWCTSTLAVINRILEESQPHGRIDDSARWKAMSDLGQVAENARASLYKQGPRHAVSIDRSTVADFFRSARELCDQTIRNAKRGDGLYESYNVLRLGDATAGVDHLDMMLEGQVAVLASGVLDAEEACDLLDALFNSELYRTDQRTFMLYPNVGLPAFMSRNVIPSDAIAESPLVQRAMKSPDVSLVSVDANGTARFSADINSHDALRQHLEELATRDDWSDLVSRDATGAHHAFERTFNHAAFTGRSGRMHKYEGLGSIYWHMVSKLLLSTQESVFQASDNDAPRELIDRLRAHYVAVRDGLGFRKTPSEFGAVPHEPYSHTPWDGGAQQPGMTGQVKEGVLARFGELGVRVHDGRVHFDSALIDASEFLEQKATMLLRREPDRQIHVPAGAVGLTLCGTPILVRPSDKNQIRVCTKDGLSVVIDGTTLTEELTREVFGRTGHIDVIDAQLQL